MVAELKIVADRGGSGDLAELLAVAVVAGRVVAEISAAAAVTSPSAPSCWTSAASPTSPTQLETALAMPGLSVLAAPGQMVSFNCRFFVWAAPL